MRNKKIFVLKIVWRKSIASLHGLTQSVQRANLRRTAGDPTWVEWNQLLLLQYVCSDDDLSIKKYRKSKEMFGRTEAWHV